MALSVLVSLFMSLCVSLSLSLFLCICLGLSVSPLPDTYFPLESDGFQFLVNISFIGCVMWSFWVGYIFLLRLLASWLNFLRKRFSSHRTSHWGPWSQYGWGAGGMENVCFSSLGLLCLAAACLGSWFSQIVLGRNERGCLSINRNLKLVLADLANKNTKCLVKFYIRWMNKFF